MKQHTYKHAFEYIGPSFLRHHDQQSCPPASPPASADGITSVAPATSLRLPLMFARRTRGDVRENGEAEALTHARQPQPESRFTPSTAPVENRRHGRGERVQGR